MNFWKSEMETRKLLDNMYREGIRFPMLPSALIRVNSVLQDPDSSLNDLASVLNIPSITVRLLQVANSPALRVRRHVSTVSDAVQLLGRNMVKSVVVCVTIRDLFSCPDVALAKRLSDSWEHGIQIASMAAVLSRLYHLDVGEALSAGILHDVGLLPIISHIERNRSSFVDVDIPWAEAQQEIGEKVLNEWGFPPELVAATHSSLRMPVCLAGTSYADLVSAAHYLTDSNPERLLALGITEAEFLHLANSDERLTFMSDIR